MGESVDRGALEKLIKHGDFIVIDILCLQACYVLSYWINVGLANPYDVTRYRYQAWILFAAQIVVTLFFDNYDGILKRKRFDEVLAVVRYILLVFLTALTYFFIVHWVGQVSRLQMGGTSVLFVLIDCIVRELNKARLRKHGSMRMRKRSVILATSSQLVAEAMPRLTDTSAYNDYFISKIVLFDDGPYDDSVTGGIPVVRISESAIADITHDWVDEVFILQPDDMAFPAQFVDDLIRMDVEVIYSISGIRSERFSVKDVGKLGPYVVLTSEVRYASVGQLIIKRIFDIVGGIVGCLITVVLAIIVGPIIYVQSPGSIFFAQDRVGLNGKTFKMYKFRSMYPDAEKRLAALESQNQLNGDLMFKMKDDPRIIGSERKGPDGKPRGIGNFIRRTSIDEFPQFFNVLKGEMSLVGTRPPTVDEWERYNLDHRARMSIKPGITGLWQVSGRSQIRDFDEVVKLDRQYIENWSIALDLIILLKTVVVVIMGRGAQ